ncbi:putative mitochondrial protein [Tanacetum coccineum]
MHDLLEDPELELIRAQLLRGEKVMEGYTLEDNHLLYQGRLVVPKTSKWIPSLFQCFYGSMVGGHGGVLKTYQRMASEIYWVGMRKDVAKLVAKCEICQRHKYSTMLPSRLLQLLELPEQVWEDVTMDFIECLPHSEGFTVILVIVDRLSKYAHFIPLRHPFTAVTVAATFLRETDGQSEVVNRSLETYLRCFTSDTPKKWAMWLSWAEYWYNTSFHSSIKTTPFKALYGQDPPRLVFYGTAQQLMKTKADSHRKDVQFEVGEFVYLKLRPYRQHFVACRANEKLAPKFFRPFEVLEKTGEVYYKLRLPESSKIHNVFHVSQLKKVIGDCIPESKLPKGLTEDMEVILQLAEVLGVRKDSKGNHFVLARWKDLPGYKATWEPFETMRQQFPDLHLEDKVVLQDGGIDTKWDKVYQRRNKQFKGVLGN